MNAAEQKAYDIVHKQLSHGIAIECGDEILDATALEQTQPLWVWISNKRSFLATSLSDAKAKYEKMDDESAQLNGRGLDGALVTGPLVVPQGNGMLESTIKGPKVAYISCNGRVWSIVK